MPFVRPVTAMGLEAPDTLMLPGLQVAVYPVMADPPFAPGAEKATDAEPLPGVAAPIVGAAGDVPELSPAGFVRAALFVGVSVTGPTAGGVIVNVWAADELLNVRTTGVERPPPEGVIVIVPV